MGQAQHGNKLQIRVSKELSGKPEERLFKVVVTFGRNVLVLEVLSDNNRFCLHFSVLNIHFVATQYNGDVFTHTYQISMPVRYILVSNS